MSLKFDQLQATKKESDMQKEVVQTIKLAGTICTQRSQQELVRLLRKHLPLFFGFQDVGILFKDQKSNLMFTLNELDDENQGDKRRSLDSGDRKKRAKPNNKLN